MTLFRDDFDGPNPHWRFWGLSDLYQGVYVNYRDGFMFLNTSEGLPSWICIYDCSRDINPVNPWLYANVEIKLRIHDDGITQNGLGEGEKFWGLRSSEMFDRQSLDFIQFVSYSPVSDPIFVGLWAQSQSSSSNPVKKLWVNEKIDPNQVGINDWHIYRFLWEPGNATMLVDEVISATTDKAPDIPMGISINLGPIQRTGSSWEGYTFVGFLPTQKYQCR